MPEGGDPQTLEYGVAGDVDEQASENLRTLIGQVTSLLRANPPLVPPVRDPTGKTRLMDDGYVRIWLQEWGDGNLSLIVDSLNEDAAGDPDRDPGDGDGAWDRVEVNMAPAPAACGTQDDGPMLRLTKMLAFLDPLLDHAAKASSQIEGATLTEAWTVADMLEIDLYARDVHGMLSAPGDEEARFDLRLPWCDVPAVLIHVWGGVVPIEVDLPKAYAITQDVDGDDVRITVGAFNIHIETRSFDAMTILDNAVAMRKAGYAIRMPTED
jgi:hypothetical protein